MQFTPRVFVFRGTEQIAACGALIREHAAEMAKEGRFLAARVYEYKANATDEQRALIWVINEQISQQCSVRHPSGEPFSAEAWHEQLKRDLLPEETAKGMRKWDYLPDGSRILKMGTEDLDRSEKTAYIEALLAHAGAELGVTIKIIERRFEP